MAAAARRTILSKLDSSSRALFRSLTSSPAQPNASFPGVARRGCRRLNSSRLPAELGSVQSLMPLHNATASALLTSMLSGKTGAWGYLSEGFATPL